MPKAGPATGAVANRAAPAAAVVGDVWGTLGAQAKAAHETNKNNEVEVRERGVPDGIENGIAEVVECTVRKYPMTHTQKERRGKPYFSLILIVRSPEEHDGVKCDGLRIQIEEPLYLTAATKRKSFNDHIAWVYNELKKLGQDPAGVSYEEVGRVLMANVVSEGTLSYFRSWKGSATKDYPNPKVRCELLGKCDSLDAVPDANDPATDVVDVQTDEVPTDVVADGVAVEPDAGDAPDVVALAAAADAGDRDSIVALKAIALEAGIEEAVVDNATNWAEVAAILGGVPAEDPAAAPSGDPEKGQVWYFQPVDKNGKILISPATRKPVARVQVEVETVNVAKKTVNLKNLDDATGKTKYANVAWDKLLPDAA